MQQTDCHDFHVLQKQATIRCDANGVMIGTVQSILPHLLQCILRLLTCENSPGSLRLLWLYRFAYDNFDLPRESYESFDWDARCTITKAIRDDFLALSKTISVQLTDQRADDLCAFIAVPQDDWLCPVVSVTTYHLNLLSSLSGTEVENYISTCHIICHLCFCLLHELGHLLGRYKYGSLFKTPVKAKASSRTRQTSDTVGEGIELIEEELCGGLVDLTNDEVHGIKLTSGNKILVNSCIPSLLQTFLRPHQTSIPFHRSIPYITEPHKLPLLSAKLNSSWLKDAQLFANCRGPTVDFFLSDAICNVQQPLPDPALDQVLDAQQLLPTAWTQASPSMRTRQQRQQESVDSCASEMLEPKPSLLSYSSDPAIKAAGVRVPSGSCLVVVDQRAVE